jgi:hypothetical protein
MVSIMVSEWGYGVRHIHRRNWFWSCINHCPNHSSGPSLNNRGERALNITAVVLEITSVSQFCMVYNNIKLLRVMY